jgi:hypothetical protein
MAKFTLLWALVLVLGLVKSVTGRPKPEPSLKEFIKKAPKYLAQAIIFVGLDSVADQMLSPSQTKTEIHYPPIKESSPFPDKRFMSENSEGEQGKVVITTESSTVYIVGGAAAFIILIISGVLGLMIKKRQVQPHPVPRQAQPPAAAPSTSTQRK